MNHRHLHGVVQLPLLHGLELSDNSQMSLLPVSRARVTCCGGVPTLTLAMYDPNVLSFESETLRFRRPRLSPVITSGILTMLTLTAARETLIHNMLGRRLEARRAFMICCNVNTVLIEVFIEATLVGPA